MIEALDYIEMLRPGLYVMELEETSGKGKDKYLSSFREVRLEDMRELNRLERRDEKPFEVVEEVSVLNEKIYSLYGRPIVKSLVNETTAELNRTMHPLRLQRWFFSDLNPMMRPLSAMATTVKSGRKPVSEDNPFRRLEAAWSDMITGSLNMYRDLRDAASEAAFFQIYGSMIALGVSGDVKLGQAAEAKLDPREHPFIKETLARIEKGGFPEALARIGAILGRFAGAIPLTRLEMGEEVVRQDKVLSKLTEDERRELVSEAGVMALLEPERTLHALPLLLTKKEDRDRVMSFLNWGLALEGITKEQRDMAGRIIDVIKAGTSPGAPAGKGRKKAPAG